MMAPLLFIMLLAAAAVVAVRRCPLVRAIGLQVDLVAGATRSAR